MKIILSSVMIFSSHYYACQPSLLRPMHTRILSSRCDHHISESANIQKKGIWQIEPPIIIAPEPVVETVPFMTCQRRSASIVNQPKNLGFEIFEGKLLEVRVRRHLYRRDEENAQSIARHENYLQSLFRANEER